MCTCTLILHAVNISPFIIVFRDYKNINNENFFQICSTCPCNVTVPGKQLGFKLLQKINVFEVGDYFYILEPKSFSSVVLVLPDPPGKQETA